MSKIVWKREWTLDCSLIDEQHKNLIEIVNMIIENKISFQDLLKKLIDYSAFHFSDEEDIMIESGYPDRFLNEHKDEHNKFKKILLDISFRAMEDDADIDELVFILQRFCVLWFQTHFLNTDKKFIEYLRNHHTQGRWWDRR